jgi:hypothetical protein
MSTNPVWLTYEPISNNIEVDATASVDDTDYDDNKCLCKPSSEHEVICNNQQCINFATFVECIKCYPTCYNRRFQKGSKVKLEIRHTDKKGFGE